MTRSFRSTPAGFVLLALLSMQLGACTVTQHVELNAKPVQSEISGVTMRSALANKTAGSCQACK